MESGEMCSAGSGGVCGGGGSDNGTDMVVVAEGVDKVIELTDQQVKDAAECEDIAEQGKEKECLGCSCYKCILDLKHNSMAAAAPDMYKALKELVALKRIKDTFGKTYGYEKRQPDAWRAAIAAIAKAEGKK